MAQVLVDRYAVNYRAAFRLAHGWSQREAAERWNERWPAEPKTFKNFSYWEVWPASTGHAPSLDVLMRLAELYECSVAELLLDFPDYRYRDLAHEAQRQLARIPAAISDPSGAPLPEPGDLTNLVQRLEEMDVNGLAKAIASWAGQAKPETSRRSLLLKLSAALSLAAFNPGIAVADGELAESASLAGVSDIDLSGIWHSHYLYFSDGRSRELEGEHYIVFRQHGGRLAGQGLPNSLYSTLNIDLSVRGVVLTGVWTERTSPAGYYKGATYHGAIQLVLDPTGRTMTGKWLGYDKKGQVNSGTWTLARVSTSTSKSATREYHFKV